MAGYKCPTSSARSTCCSATSRDAVKADNKEAAGRAAVDIARPPISVSTQLWTRVNALDSPWVFDDHDPGHRDRRQTRCHHGAEGAGRRDIHYIRSPAGPVGGAGGLATDPRPRHSETAGVANVEEICGASPRMQGISLGPTDLAADRRMKTTCRWWASGATWTARIPSTATSTGRGPRINRDLLALHRAWSMPARWLGSSPTTDRSGDGTSSRARTVSNAFPPVAGRLVAAPVQIAIAKRSSLARADVAHARRVGGDG